MYQINQLENERGSRSQNITTPRAFEHVDLSGVFGAQMCSFRRESSLFTYRKGLKLPAPILDTLCIRLLLGVERKVSHGFPHGCEDLRKTASRNRGGEVAHVACVRI